VVTRRVGSAVKDAFATDPHRLRLEAKTPVRLFQRPRFGLATIAHRDTDVLRCEPERQPKWDRRPDHPGSAIPQRVAMPELLE